MHTLSRKAILIALLVIATLLSIASWMVYDYLKPPILPLSCTSAVGDTFSYRGDIIASWSYGWEVKWQHYPWCTENDIFVYTCEKWQVRSQIWAACDIGASTSTIPWDQGDQEKSLWKFFAWWNNRGIYLGESVSGISDGLWTSIMVYFWYTPQRVSDWSTDPVWPCEKWYHIPTQTEWKTAAWFRDNQSLGLLRLSTAWLPWATGSTLWNVGESEYWSTTTANVTHDLAAEVLEIDYSNAFIARVVDYWRRAFFADYREKTGKSRIRCIRDTLIK